MKKRSLIPALLGIVAGMGISALAHSAVMYSYTGNPFNVFANNTPPAGSYSTANAVTGWFELDTALGNNLALTSITGLTGFDFSFTDGRNTVMSSSVGLTINQFRVGTDASGNIDEWLIAIGFVANPLLVGSQSATIQTDGEILISAATLDRGVLGEVTVAAVPGQSPAQTVQDSGQIRNRPGTWERTTSVPEPASLALVGLGLIGIGTLRYKKRKA